MSGAESEYLIVCANGHREYDRLRWLTLVPPDDEVRVPDCVVCHAPRRVRRLEDP